MHLDGLGAPVFLIAKLGKKGRYKWKRIKKLEALPKEPITVPSADDPFVINVPSETDRVDTKLYFGRCTKFGVANGRVV
ncbi:protein PHLOEM PROTEIN 2-LIKE A9-like isoform 2 [Corchorus capsularis]|uniref:Protein PHLOEM PROTEIN 2-LIKE A9-like isoform 2 n=1 Tax=Corchorus capsularis TaxID=210143 RepID=A0A1R3HJE5_COCAP|nr:protein PHLOEM PROTEIN 2-LIKE A9-like isoform 2 [Corchorus capsularis]